MLGKGRGDGEIKKKQWTTGKGINSKSKVHTRGVQRTFCQGKRKKAWIFAFGKAHDGLSTYELTGEMEIRGLIISFGTLTGGFERRSRYKDQRGVGARTGKSQFVRG